MSECQYGVNNRIRVRVSNGLIHKYSFVCNKITNFFTIGYTTLRSWCKEDLIYRPFVPHINSWYPCYFAYVQNGFQAYILNVLRFQN